MKRTIVTALVGTALLVSGCAANTSSTTVKSMQRKDKMLSCKEILLEMNEAEFYQKTAQENKSPNLKNVLMPLGYISTYMSAEDAIESAKARVDYLDRIYQIMDCEAKNHSRAAEGAGYAPARAQGTGAEYRDAYMVDTPKEERYYYPQALPDRAE